MNINRNNVYCGGLLALMFLEEEEIAAYYAERRQHRFWVRPWLRRRADPGTDTIYTLLREICHVSEVIKVLYSRIKINKQEKSTKTVFTLQDGDGEEMRRTLRMPVAVYNELLELLRPAITKQTTNYRSPISAEERLAITMRYLALGDGPRSLHQQFRVGYNMVGRIVKEVCEAIHMVLNEEYLACPSTKEDWHAIATGFKDRWNLPHCLGALDGKHFRITKPPGSGSLYFNYKGFFSIVLLAAVDYNYEFMWVQCGAEGCASDSSVWRDSSLLSALQREDNPLDIPADDLIEGIPTAMPYFFVADDAFALTTRCMKPFPHHGLTVQERIFNYRISRARMVVENAFGILSTRFRIFRREIECRPETAEKIVIAACCLHNFLRRKCGASYIPRAAVDNENGTPGTWREEEPLPSTGHQRSRNPATIAKELRQALKGYFITPQGEYPPQYHRIGHF